MLGDEKAFIDKVLAGLNRYRAEDPSRNRKELESMQDRLLKTRSRWQELDANDLLTLGELQEKLTAIARELKTLEAELDREAQLPGEDAFDGHCRREIGRFLALETVTNADMRRLVDHITVDREGNVRVLLRKFEECP